MGKVARIEELEKTIELVCHQRDWAIKLLKDMQDFKKYIEALPEEATVSYFENGNAVSCRIGAAAKVLLKRLDDEQSQIRD